jgi:hypothetical protein
VAHGRDFRQEFLAKLYFAQDDPGISGELIEHQCLACQDWLAELEERTATTEQHSYDWLVLQFRVGQMRAILAWLDTCLSALVDLRPA